ACRPRQPELFHKPINFITTPKTMKRTLLSLLLPLAFATTFAALPAHAQDAANPPMKLAHIQAGFQHFRIGDVELVALSDGTLPIPADQLFTNATPAEITAALAKTY